MASELGAYWTDIPPTGAYQATLDSALLPKWGNNAQFTSSARFPAGTTIYEGIVGPQNWMLGGGHQIYTEWVDPNWIIK